MKTKIGWSLSVLTAVLANAIFAGAAVTLTVLNPRGEIIPPPLIAPSARIPDLANRKIAIYWNGKEGGDNFWSDVEALIKLRLPNTTVLRYNGPIQPRIDSGEIPADRVLVFKKALKPGGKLPLLDRPEDLRIVVVGGIPGYTFSMSYFREGLYAPTSDQTKLIRGATLTKAGH